MFSGETKNPNYFFGICSILFYIYCFSKIILIMAYSMENKIKTNYNLVSNVQTLIVIGLVIRDEAFVKKSTIRVI